LKTTGMIIEYNPLHGGHLYLIEEIRRKLGQDTAVIGVMSGDFVQRGDFAIVRRQARAKAAVESGVDLVLELPLPWTVGSAERFADGGVGILEATGVVDYLAFGSECGDAAVLQQLASVLRSEAFPQMLKEELATGVSFAAARQRAVERLMGAEEAAVLENPNNILGVEYCKSLLRRDSRIQPLTVKRKGTGYHGTELQEQTPSATMLRDLLRRGERETALALMAPAMRDAFEEEERAGRAPVFLETCERAILARLRSMSEEEFARLDEGREGLYHRLYEASRTAASLEEILNTAKTKRYAYSRLQRMILWAWLGWNPADCPEEIPYIRVLAANETGRVLLGRMRKCASIPVVTKPQHVRRLGGESQALFSMEAQAADLYALAYPELSAAVGGSLWREGPVIR
jgi:predicted nucleotidyltransferase